MTINKFKDEIYNSKIQVIQISPEGKILESENNIFSFVQNKLISDYHPFFEGIAPLFKEASEKIHFPCVNLEIASKNIIADIDLIPEKNKLFLLIIDFTDHYKASHPLVQEKNEAFIQKVKLSYERDILIAKEDLKNKFMAHLNHEIRNPLNHLLGFMNILGNSKLSYEQKETLNIMSKTGTHLKVLLDDLLDISKIEKGIVELRNIPFSLFQIVNSLAKHFQLKYHKSGINLEVHFDKDVPIRVMGDPTRINQILFNLIENAFKNTESGVISVSVGVKKKDLVKKLYALLFTISDTGKGMPKEKLPYIFDTYQQLEFGEIKPIGKGIGLKIVKELVALLKGTVKIESSEGVGTTYEIVLPFIEKEKKEKKKKSVPKGTGIVISRRILIIENEEINQMLLMKTFLDNDSGYFIEIARDGAMAKNLLVKRKYTLVLLKMQLPDMDCFEIISHIRNNQDTELQKTPILVVSGSNMKEEQEKVLVAGATEFLSKPYTKKELFSKISKALKK
jgi:signal transduction histidine kinase/CheY-like chemotaxis protein